jgi:Flp pilus assembly protein TadD
MTQAVTLDEYDVRWWLLLARFYVDNEYRVADYGLPAARQAVALAPNDAQAIDTLGFALVLTGDLSNGQKLLEQALALNPQAASVYYHLGVLHSRQGNTADAELMLNHALALDPDGLYGGLACKRWHAGAIAALSCPWPEPRDTNAAVRPTATNDEHAPPRR